MLKLYECPSTMALSPEELLPASRNGASNRTGISGSSVQKYLSSDPSFVRLNPFLLGPFVISRCTGKPDAESRHVKFDLFWLRDKLKTVGQVKIVMGCKAWETAITEIDGRWEPPRRKLGGLMATWIEIESIVVPGIAIALYLIYITTL